MNLANCWVFGAGRVVVAFEHDGQRINKHVRSGALSSGGPVNEDEEVLNLSRQLEACAREAAQDFGLK